MKFKHPKKVTFSISVALAGLGLLGTLISIPFVSSYTFALVVIAYILLVLGLFIKGL